MHEQSSDSVGYVLVGLIQIYQELGIALRSGLIILALVQKEVQLSSRPMQNVR